MRSPSMSAKCGSHNRTLQITTCNAPRPCRLPCRRACSSTYSIPSPLCRRWYDKLTANYLAFIKLTSIRICPLIQLRWCVIQWFSR